MRPIVLLSVTLMAVIVCSQPLPAIATVPFTEDFVSSVANWADGSGANLATYVASGGPDGSSFASSTATGFNAADGLRMVVFRGQDEFNSSGHAFEGDWLGSGINRFQRLCAAQRAGAAAVLSFGSLLPVISQALAPITARSFLRIPGRK